VERAGVVLYDFDATTPSFLATLLHAHRNAEVVRDRIVRGQHRPRVVLRRSARSSRFEAAVRGTSTSAPRERGTMLTTRAGPPA